MRGTAKRLIEAQAPAVPDGGDPLCDYRFRRLVPRAAWDALPEDVRHRFSKSLTGAAVTTYSGEIVWTRLSAAGWPLAQFCRPIGAPLPLASSGPASGRANACTPVTNAHLLCRHTLEKKTILRIPNTS